MQVSKIIQHVRDKVEPRNRQMDQDMLNADPAEEKDDADSDSENDAGPVDAQDWPSSSSGSEHDVEDE